MLKGVPIPAVSMPVISVPVPASAAVDKIDVSAPTGISDLEVSVGDPSGGFSVSGTQVGIWLCVWPQLFDPFVTCVIMEGRIIADNTRLCML